MNYWDKKTTNTWDKFAFEEIDRYVCLHIQLTNYKIRNRMCANLYHPMLI